MSDEKSISGGVGGREASKAATKASIETAGSPPLLTNAQAERTTPQTPEAFARAAEEARREVGLVPIPGYEIEGELGRGGMGVVYKARQAKLNRMVALKMARGGRIGERELIRFLAEAESVAAVRHANVVQVYDYGEVEGQPYMALEFCAGGTLANRVRDGARLPVVGAAKLVAKVAGGVAVAHEQGIVHRDLKPANILLDDAGEPKVADFGIAKRIGRDLTATEAVMGTPDYMAPEQAGGKTKFVGPSADVWALGVILYECLTGVRPFAAESTQEVLAKVLTTEPPGVRTVMSEIPADLELICRKCLEKNPSDRYPTARELADDLGRFTRGEPISIRPPGTVERVYKWARRNPTRAAAYGLILVATGLLALATGAVWLWRDAEGRGVQAEQKRQNAEILRAREADGRRQELLQAASGVEAEALDRLRTGRPKAAKQALEDFIPRLRGDELLTDRLNKLEARLKQAEQLDTFEHYANIVWRGAWDDDRNGAELVVAGQKALSSVGVLTPDGRFTSQEWWRDLPDQGLGEDQRARLRGEIYQQIVLVAIMHLRESGRPLIRRFETGGLLALINGGPIPEAAAELRRSLEFTEQARAWEKSQGAPPTRTVILLRRSTAMMLDWLGDKETAKRVVEAETVDGPAPGRPTLITASEYYFDGLIHFSMSRYNNATMKLVAVLMKSDFETVHTMERAEESLRIAASMDPNRLWPHFMLGWALLARNDFGGAELAFNECVRIDPKDPRIYIYRAKALVRRALKLNGETAPFLVQQRKDLLARGAADRDRALALDPLLAETHFVSGELELALGDTTKSLASYGRYLDLEDRTVNARILRKHWLTEVGATLTDVLKTKPNDPEAISLLALLHLRKHDFAEAGKTAEKCLQLSPDNARALAVRGAVRFQSKDWDAAQKDFDRALLLEPANYFAAVGQGLSFERAGEYDKALAAYERLAAAPEQVTPKWQQAEAHLGRSRVLEKLKRSNEAAAALAAAREKDSKAVAFLLANPPLPK